MLTADRRLRSPLGRGLDPSKVPQSPRPGTCPPCALLPGGVRPDPTDRQFINALSRGLMVLQAFSPGDPPLSNGELVRRTGLPKPTVFRITHTLTALGYLRVDWVTGRYVLCPHVLSLGYPVLAQHDVRQVTRPLMQYIADDVLGTVALGTRTGLQMIYIERCRHINTSALPLDIGSPMPMETCAMGRSYLAGLDPVARTEELNRLRLHHGDKWDDLLYGIEEAMEQYERCGYVTAVGSWYRDINGVGVPIRLPDGTIYGLTIGGYAKYVPEHMLPDLGERLIRVADAVMATQSLHRVCGADDVTPGAENLKGRERQR